MYKKVFDFVYAIFSLLMLLAFGIAVAHAQQSQNQTTFKIFIPAAFRIPPATYSIQGKVANQQNTTIHGVTIRTNKGQQSITDQHVEFSLSGLAAGTYTGSVSKTGMLYSPTTTVVIVPPDVSHVFVTALAQCTQAIVNGGFEDNTGWVHR
jgi:hypothetical protein